MKNSQPFMSKFVNEILRRINFCFCYIDEILIFSHNMEDYFRRLTLVFERLKYYGLILNK